MKYTLKDVLEKEIYPLIINTNIFNLITHVFYKQIDLKCILYYRLAILLRNKRVYFLPTILNNKVKTKFSSYISLSSNIGLGMFFPHPSSIIIGKGVTIGDNCIIYQNVTIGGARIGDGTSNKYPKIGNNVTIFSGAKIIGNITIGDNCTVGANALVNKSFKSNSTIVGIPGRIIK